MKNAVLSFASRFCIPLFGLVITAVLTACDGTASGGTTESASTTSGASAEQASQSARLTIEAYTSKRARRTTTPSAPAVTISGTPITTVIAGSTYSFTPSTANANGNALTFSISNLPAWATFNTNTGQLAGTPAASGSYPGITISVSNGQTFASLAPFVVTVTAPANVASVTLSWLAPTQNTDGSALTNLTGYRIYYGSSASTLNQSVALSSPGALTYVIDNLTAGTWYFAVKAVNSSGTESALSAVASTTIG
jgi:hypothetical protein